MDANLLQINNGISRNVGALHFAAKAGIRRLSRARTAERTLHFLGARGRLYLAGKGCS